MSHPLIGHLDPEFICMMEENKEMLRAVFQTKNQMTFPVSGTGSAGMEFCLVNLIEPGDEVIIGVNGVFGTRMVDVAQRCGAKVTKVESEWGRIIEPGQIAEALKQVAKPKLVAVVHAETSTGALTPVEEIGKLARAAGALFLIDTVTSLAGCPVKIDEWGVDAVYSGTQKCLSCPPGLAPVSLSDRALQVATSRKVKVQSWYLDVNLLARSHQAHPPAAFAPARARRRRDRSEQEHAQRNNDLRGAGRPRGAARSAHPHPHAAPRGQAQGDVDHHRRAEERPPHQTRARADRPLRGAHDPHRPRQRLLGRPYHLSRQ
jgi:aspartate aminotransferase-like enzyme